MINFWKLSYEAVKKQRDQLKQETEKLCERNKELEKRCNQKVRRYLRGGLQQRRIVDLESKYNAMKTQRDTLIDDLAVVRANSERYRKRAENAMDYAERSQCEVMRLERENEKQLELLKDFSKFINYKLIVSPASDTYKHYRSELDKLGVK